MSDRSESDHPLFGVTREEMLEALFADLVARQTNLALMFMGQVRNPQASQPTLDLEAARTFIEQLEMLEAKTQGNLSKSETKFLRDSLTHLRRVFVSVSARAAQAAPQLSVVPDAEAVSEESALNRGEA